MRDAMRKVEVKIFKAKITYRDGKVQYCFFINRFELGDNSKGTESVYKKLNAVQQILTAEN